MAPNMQLQVNLEYQVLSWDTNSPNSAKTFYFSICECKLCIQQQNMHKVEVTLVQSSIIIIIIKNVCDIRH